MEQASLSVNFGNPQKASAETSSSIVNSGTFSEVYNALGGPSNTSQYQTTHNNAAVPVEEVELTPEPTPTPAPTPTSTPTPMQSTGATNAGGTTSFLQQMSALGGTLRETAANLASEVVSFCDRLGEAFSGAIHRFGEAMNSFLHGGQETIELPVTLAPPTPTPTPTPTPDTSDQVDTEVEELNPIDTTESSSEGDSSAEILDEIGDPASGEDLLEPEPEEVVYDRNKILTEAEMSEVKFEARDLANSVLAGMDTQIQLKDVTVYENGNVMIEFTNAEGNDWLKLIYNVNDPTTMQNITTFVTGDTGYNAMVEHVINPLLPNVNDFAFVGVSPNAEGDIKECSDVSMNLLNALADKYKIEFKYAELSGWSQGAYGAGVFYNSLEKILDHCPDIDINLKLYGAKDNGHYLADYLNRNPSVVQSMIDNGVVLFMYEEYGDGKGYTDNVRSQLGPFVDKGLLVVEARNHRLRLHDSFVYADQFRIIESNNIRNGFSDVQTDEGGYYSDQMFYHVDTGMGGDNVGEKETITLAELAARIKEYKGRSGTETGSESHVAVQLDSQIDTEVEAPQATQLDAHVEAPAIESTVRVRELSTKKMTAIWDAGYTIDYDYVAANGTKCIVIKKNGVEIDENSVMYVSLPDGMHNHSIKEAYSDYLVTLAKKNQDLFHDVIVIPAGDYVANERNVNRYRDAVNEIADTLGVNHYVVAGESAGGDTAVQWAIMYPNDKRLVAVDAIANSAITMGSNTQGRGMGNATPEQQQALANSHIVVRIFPLKYNSGTIFDKWIEKYHPANVVMATDDEGRPRYFADGNGKAVAYTDAYFYAPNEYATRQV